MANKSGTWAFLEIVILNPDFDWGRPMTGQRECQVAKLLQRMGDDVRIMYCRFQIAVSPEAYPLGITDGLKRRVNQIVDHGAVSVCR